MANPLPGLRGTSEQALYPFSRIVSFDTKITTWMNGSEQRWVSRPPLTNFVLPMTVLSAADKSSYVTLFSTAKGQFAQNITLTLGTTTWEHLTMMSDHMAF